MTQAELAKTIGCSRATLDRVLNNREGVGDKRRAEILSRIKEIGYKPNLTGKMLAMQKRTAIGIILGVDKTPVDSPVFKIIQDSMMACSERLSLNGIRFVYKNMRSGEAKEQIQLIHDLVNEGVSGIAFAFRKRTKELYDTIRYYQNKGIEFVPYFNTLVEPGVKLEFKCHLDTDQVREGRIAAELISKFNGGTGKVALISGLEENYVHQLRVDSAKAFFEAECPGIEVLPVYKNCYPKDRAEKISREIMKQHPDLNGMIISCGFAGTITENLEKLKKKNHIPVVLFDFTKRAMMDLKDKRCDAVIGVDLKQLGYNTVNTIYELVFRNEVEEENWNIPLQVLVRESVI